MVGRAAEKNEDLKARAQNVDFAYKFHAHLTTLRSQLTRLSVTVYALYGSVSLAEA